MDGECRPTVLAKVLRNVVCNALRADEDQDLSVLTANHVKVLQQSIALLVLSDDFDVLLDVVVSRQIERTNVDLDEVAQEILRNATSGNKSLIQSHEKARTEARRWTSLGQVALNIKV